jgi:hypothetical protein
MRLPERSIPLLQDAVARLTDKNQRELAQFALFESYLDTRDWGQAEATFSAAAHQAIAEPPRWQARLAVVAAKSGAKSDALRIWKTVANVNPCFRGSLDDLVKAGLASELRAFYEDFAKRLPTSIAPARALKVIAESEAR